MPINKILLKNIVQDKIDELKQSTIDSAARKRTAQLRDPNFKGEEVPIYKAGTKEEIGKRRKPGRGVIQLRLQGRKESPGKPAKKPLYKNITPGATGRAARQDASYQPVYDRMAEMLIERSLFRDVYKFGKGVGKAAIGISKLGYRGLRGLRGVGKLGINLAKKTGGAVKSAYTSAMKPSQDLTQGIARSTVKRNMELDSDLEQENELQTAAQAEARAKKKQEIMDKRKSVETENQRVKNLNKLRSKATRAPGQEYKRSRQVAGIKAMGDRERAREKAAADREEEEGRKLVNYESISHRDVMLQKIAEAMLIERGVPSERLHEWGSLILKAITNLPAIFRGAKTLKQGKDLFGIARAGYSGYKSGGLGGAARAVGRRGLTTIAKQFASDNIPYAPKELVGNFSDSLADTGKKYVTSAMKKALGPAADKIKKGASIANKTSSAFKNKKEEKPEQDDTNLNYPYRGDDDDDQ